MSNSDNNPPHHYPYYLLDLHHQGSFSFHDGYNNYSTAYNPPMPLQNPSHEFDQMSIFSHQSLPSAALDYHALSTTYHNDVAVASVVAEKPPTSNSPVSLVSSPEGAVEEDKKDPVAPVSEEPSDGKAKKDKGKTKEEKKPRQPRFAFMTKSEVDNLEDGYRWRKYGQKAVKNSHFPRSYYRCTSPKCNVKKRIERSYQDPMVVITTYEGQHNHHSPAIIRGNAAAAALLGQSQFPLLSGNFSQDIFIPSINDQFEHHQRAKFSFFTHLMDQPLDQQSQELLNHHDQYFGLLPGMVTSFLHKPQL